MPEPEALSFFAIPLPDGRVARIPADLVEAHVVADARCTHTEGDDDDGLVTAHHLSLDAVSGAHHFHTDWEFGECDYVDDAGFPQRKHTWHRHPFGTEYAELYEGR